MNKNVFIISGFLFMTVVSNAQVTYIDGTKVKQYIDGFGASTAWHGQISETDANIAFNNDNNSQLGLSILRVRIDPDSLWADEKMNAIKAKARGAIILASPWTPPASMKTNNSKVGGELKTTSYPDYANFLKTFCDSIGNVDVISIQNEPNIIVDYESCTWNAVQFKNFCKNNASAIGKPVMIPEAFNFDTKLSDSTLNDSVASSKITFIGGHLYGVKPFYYVNALKKGKRVWMTENYYNNDDIFTCTSMAKEITDCMYDNMSAYIWWWLVKPGCNLININGTIKKKGYTMAQFSKFIRPGYNRIDATYQPQPGVYVTAFKGTENVLVVVNLNGSSKNQTFTFKNDTVNRVMKYTTSAIKNLSYEGTIDLNDSSFYTTIDSNSITTFVSTKTVECPQTPIIPYLQVNNGKIINTNKITCIFGDSIILSPQAGKDSSWSWNGCGTSGSWNKQTIHPDGTCTSIIATYTNNCGAITSLEYSITVEPNVGINNSEIYPNTLVFPNPAISGTFNIKLPDYFVGNKINIINLFGQKVYSNSILSDEMTINSGLKPGIYFLNITGKGSSFSAKLILK